MKFSTAAGNFLQKWREREIGLMGGGGGEGEGGGGKGGERKKTFFVKYKNVYKRTTWLFEFT